MAVAERQSRRTLLQILLPQVHRHLLAHRAVLPAAPVHQVALALPAPVAHRAAVRVPPALRVNLSIIQVLTRSKWQAGQ